ncbi:MAG: hypothetical protein E7K72_27520 [Roseomonas mucosa]|nr:hypothetical protein [Roseomonas mucosa]
MQRTRGLSEMTDLELGGMARKLRQQIEAADRVLRQVERERERRRNTANLAVQPARGRALQAG